IKHDLAAGLGSVAGGQEVSLHGWRGPIGKCEPSHGSARPRWLLEILRTLRHLERIHTLGRHGEQAGIGEIAIKRLVEGAHKGLGRAGATKVRYSHNRALGTHDFDDYGIVLRHQRSDDAE